MVLTSFRGWACFDGFTLGDGRDSDLRNGVSGQVLVVKGGDVKLDISCHCRSSTEARNIRSHTREQKGTMKSNED